LLGGGKNLFLLVISKIVRLEGKKWIFNHWGVKWLGKVKGFK